MASMLCPVVVGRSDEVDLLRARVRDVSRGRGGLVVIEGDAGIGKSRLAHETRLYAQSRNALVVTGRAVPAAATIPYRPLTEALLQSLRTRDVSDDPRLTRWLPMLEALVPMGVGGGDHRSPDPSPVRAEAVLQLLRLIAGTSGLLVVLEDLHWSDPDTLDVVEYLADNLPAEPVLCIATVRTERTSTPSDALLLAERLHARRGATVIALDRLTDRQVEDMVRACLHANTLDRTDHGSADHSSADHGGADDGRADPTDVLLARIRANADGVPFLVEELLASPGVPRSLADTVRARVQNLDPNDRTTLEFAAVLGRQFDWRLLPDVTGLPIPLVAQALRNGVDVQLLAAPTGAFRFRHALTREAVLQALLPTRRADIAGRLLAVVDTLPHETSFSLVDVVADLAEQSGDRRRAGQLLATSGRESLDRGALATAADALRRAGELLETGADRCAALLAMTQALALAGRVDEAVASGERLLPQLPTDQSRAELHVSLATAMVAAARWNAASSQLDRAQQILATGELSGDDPAHLHDQISVLRAEIDLAADHFDRARRHAEAVLSSMTAVPDLRCHALELIGRSHRTRDLATARLSFEQALSLARASDLPLATLRSLHELGTIDMFDHAGTERLLEARQLADRLGALATGGVLDLHLAATYMFVFDLDAAWHHAEAAVAISTRLALDELRALALLFSAQIAALRCQEDVMERYLSMAAAIAGTDQNIDGSGWCGARGMLALLTGRSSAAMDAFARGIALLGTLPNSGPANYRGLWPLLLAAANDLRTSAEVADARRHGMDVNRCNRGLLAYAEAIMCGRRGETARAGELALNADADLVHYPVWAAIGRLHAAPAALDNHWGQPLRWLTLARDCFDSKGLTAMSVRCGALLDGATDHSPRRWGVTAREGEVLQLVAEGLSNKDIATILFVSPRTVEKHVESLLRKAGARSRTQLVALARVPAH